jgi:hypothetical protein
MTPTMTTQKKRTMKATVFSPFTQTTRIVQIHKLQASKLGLLGKIVGCNYNVFRKWDDNVWMEDVTESNRFSLETTGMTNDEINIVMNEADATKVVC